MIPIVMIINHDNQILIVMIINHDNQYHNDFGLVNDYNRPAEITIISGIMIKTCELYTCLLMIIGSVFNQFDIDR